MTARGRHRDHDLAAMVRWAALMAGDMAQLEHTLTTGTARQAAAASAVKARKADSRP